MPLFIIHFLDEIVVAFNCVQQEGTIIFLGYISKSTLENYTKTSTIVLENNIAKGKSLSFSQSRKPSSSLLGHFIWEVSDHGNHIKQCHQVMLLENNNQFTAC